MLFKLHNAPTKLKSIYNICILSSKYKIILYKLYEKVEKQAFGDISFMFRCECK